jgi:hypothetical protein
VAKVLRQANKHTGLHMLSCSSQSNPYGVTQVSLAPDQAACISGPYESWAQHDSILAH